MLRVIQTTEDVADLGHWLSEQSFIAIDTETSGHPIFHPDFRVRTVQVGCVNAAWIIEFDQWQGLVADIIRRYRGTIVWHNAGFDAAALARYGIHIDWSRCEDTMIALRLAEPDESAKLKEAAVRHVSPGAGDAQADLHAAMKKQDWDWDTVPLDFPVFQRYAGLDPVLTARLYEKDVVKLGMASPVYDLEMQVRAICNRIEANGVRVDETHCRVRSNAYARETEMLKQAHEDEFGFSITSNDKLAEWLLASDARHHMTKLTRGGKPSVDAEVLEALVAAGEPTVPGVGLPVPEWAMVAATALRIRKLDKYRAAYFDHFIEPTIDGLMHATIETLAARTGRMGVREPALHQLPAPGEDKESRDIRAAVIPSDDDHVLLCADYDQIELRLAAIDSADPKLIEAFRLADETGIDFFTASARDIYNEPDFDRSDPRRGPIKAYWYSSLYGAGVGTQARTAGVTVDRMTEIRKRVSSRYPAFTALKVLCEGHARRQRGWIETPNGRRLKVPEDKQYVATNYRIQGWAADIMKQALVAMGQAGLEDHIIMLVHDEAVLSVPEADAEEVAAIVQASMEDHDHAVPLTTGNPVRVQNWAEAK